MKQAALYARVSGDLQAKEGTIESQVLALKKQIATAGHVLVKEYIDNGFSGPRFDRPALNGRYPFFRNNFLSDWLHCSGCV